MKIREEKPLEVLEGSSSSAPSMPRLHRIEGDSWTGSGEVGSSEDGTRVYDLLDSLGLHARLGRLMFWPQRSPQLGSGESFDFVYRK